MDIQSQSANKENPFTAAQTAFSSLVRELSSTESAALTHSEVESLIDSDGREILRLVFQGYLDLQGPGLALEPVANSNDTPLTHERLRSRALESLFGTVHLCRLGYSARDEQTLYPLDADLNLPRERYSLGVRRRVVEEVVRGSFDEAGEALSRSTGAKVPKRQLGELTQRAAVDFDEFYSLGSVAELAEKQTGSLLVLTVDGKGVQMRKEHLREATRKQADKHQHRLTSKLSRGEKRGRKRMATVTAVYTIEPYERTAEAIVNGLFQRIRAVHTERPRPENKRLWATLEKSSEQAIDEMFQEAHRRDPKRRKTWLVLVDGHEPQLEAVKRQARKHRASLTIVLDIMHVLHYLWQASHAFNDEGSEQSEVWVAERLQNILEGKAGLVAGGMRRSATLRGLKGAERDAVDECAHYLLKYKSYLRYDEYLAEGYPIATGVIEGGCRHLINDRLDRTGARWSLQGAEAVLKLRSLRASGDLDEYWNFHEQAEYLRSHVQRYAVGPPRVLRADLAARSQAYLRLVE